MASRAPFAAPGADMLENLAEMLMTHHVGGRWRAPLSQRMRDVRGPRGALLGRMVEAGPADVQRALRYAEGAAQALVAPGAEGRAAFVQRFLAEWAERAAWVEAARRREGFSGGLTPRELSLPGGGPVALLGSVLASPGLMAGAVAAGLRAGRPVLLKPAPRAPFTALVLAEALAAAGPPPGAFALLQGGGRVTGMALRSQCGTERVVLLGKPPRCALAGVPSCL